LSFEESILTLSEKKMVFSKTRALRQIFWTTALAILILIVVVGVLSGLFSNFDKQSLIKDRDATCDDGNDCTIDFDHVGGCSSVRKKNGTECSNHCYSDGVTDYCNVAGQCVGDSCRGASCSNVTADCTDLDDVDDITATCQLGVCAYIALF
jgi:hypothetical protein